MSCSGRQIICVGGPAGRLRQHCDLNGLCGSRPMSNATTARNVVSESPLSGLLVVPTGNPASGIARLRVTEKSAQVKEAGAENVPHPAVPVLPLVTCIANKHRSIPVPDDSIGEVGTG